MKKITPIVLLFLISLILQSRAASLTLAWDPDGFDPTNGPVLYKVYYGPASATYTNTVSAGTNLTATVTNLTKGQTYYFAATAALTNTLESTYSNEINWTVGTNPPAPSNLRVTVSVVVDVNVNNVNNVNALAPKK